MSSTHGGPSSGRTWKFDLARHDDPEPEGDQPEGAEGEDAEAQDLLADAADGDDPEAGDRGPEGADQLGDAGKKALERMKAERARARKEAAAAKKAAADAQKKVREYEDRDKSEAEKLASRAEAAEKRAEAATARAVTAEVRALATSDFADPEDAAAFLDLSQYTADGEIDTDSLRADLDDLLERKPHLRKQAPAPRAPKPDPSQGSRKDPTPTDYRTADRDEVKRKLAEYGVRLRS